MSNNPYTPSAAWHTVAEAYDDLAHVPHHRPLAGDVCSCGEEFTSREDLVRHVEAASQD